MDLNYYWIGMSWKVNQQIYKLLAIKTDVLGVDISTNCICEVEGPLLIAIVKQFYNTDTIYIPAKSYCVAIVYATELSKDFGGRPIDYLNDPKLLLDDIYYKTYDQDSEIYSILLNTKYWVDTPMAHRIRDYYRKEMLLEGFNHERTI